MPKLLQINVTANWGSTGKIAEGIGQVAIASGWDSMIAYGRGNPTSSSFLYRIGNDTDMRFHGIATRLLDRHGLMSINATKKFIDVISNYRPDIIHLHNIHGYYLNYPLLFEWLKTYNKPIIWTLHDCWPWTGHCAYYTYSKCNRWKDECGNCPNKKMYPSSFWDGSKRNLKIKKTSFNNINNLTLVPVSYWLKNEVEKSFMQIYPSKVIHNGIDLNVFKPSCNSDKIISTYKLKKQPLLLGVASVWDKRKGLDEFIALRKILPEQYQILLVGLNQNQIKALPFGIKGIARTNNIQELVDLYSAADVFVNPTLEDNFPTTNLEALGCNTPVVTYNTGGSPESIDYETGRVVGYKDIAGLNQTIQEVCTNSIDTNQKCRQRAELLFNQKTVYQKYIDLYQSLLNK